MVKKILIGLLVLVIVIQFFPAEKNISDALVTENDISNTVAISQQVHDILRSKCYDCHSNNTIYPWYSNFQPVGWWMADHIKDAKGELNFSEFKTYTEKKANHKLEEIYEEVSEGNMPLSSYTLIHRSAVVTSEELILIGSWLKSLNVPIKE